MKSRLCFAALAVVALVAAHSLRAADAPALKCPVSGGPTKADKTVDFNGGKVQFCCEKCPVAFSKDTAKYAGMAVASELCGHADANGAAATSRSALGLKFLSDAFADGRRFRILAIVDDFTGLVADTSLPGCLGCLCSIVTLRGGAACE